MSVLECLLHPQHVARLLTNQLLARAQQIAHRAQSSAVRINCAKKTRTSVPTIQPQGQQSFPALQVEAPLIAGEEFFDRSRVLGGVAGNTCRNKIAGPVRAAPRPGTNELKGRGRRVATPAVKPK